MREKRSAKKMGESWRVWWLAFCCVGAICGSLGWGAGVAEACLESSQNRLFPLGTAKGKLLLLQIRAVRDGGEEVHWKGAAYLRFASRDGRWLTQGTLAKAKKIADIKIIDRTYSKELQPILAKAIALARKVRGFRPLRSPTLGFCKFQRDCRVAGSSYSLKVSPKGILSVARSRKKAPLSMHEVVLSHEVRERFGRKMSYSFEESTLADRARWLGYLDFGSYRLYRAGRQTFLVLNLALGGKSLTITDKNGKEKKINTKDSHSPRWKRCRSIKRCMPKDPALWHGLAFDTVLFLRR